MSLIISKHDAKRIADLYQLICQELIFPGVSQEQREKVMIVLEGVRQSGGNLEVDCKFATEPALRQMQILITTKAVEGPKVAQ